MFHFVRVANVREVPNGFEQCRLAEVEHAGKGLELSSAGGPKERTLEFLAGLTGQVSFVVLVRSTQIAVDSQLISSGNPVTGAFWQLWLTQVDSSFGWVAVRTAR